MPHIGRSLTFAGLTALYAYLLLLGGTYGILIPTTRWLSLGAAALVGVGWLVAHWRGRWPWAATALDGPFLLWLVAILLSMLLNPVAWRREAIGLWFALLYIGVWYVLSDLMTRGVLRRGQLMQVVPLGGVVVVALGYWQVAPWVTQTLPRMLAGVEPFALPRPGSSLGNPNTLAAVLVVLVPFAVALGLRARGGFRWLAWGLAGAGALLMVLTYSRGGWLGLLAALLVLAGLLLLDRRMFNLDNLRAWWARQDRSVRAGVVTTLLAGVLLVMGVLIVGLVSLGTGGRGIGLRTFIYSAAVNLFAENPLAGQGLFTFGSGLASQASTPPYQTHSHAHNMILHIAAELGIAGLIALLATLLATVRAVRANWKAATSNERVLLAGAFGAVAGFVIHHQLDFPAMVPVVALTGLVALVAAIAPVGAVAAAGARRARLSLGLVAVLWGGLVLSGGWAALRYSDYNAALWVDADGGAPAYRASAEQLQAVIDLDPDLAVYHYQQGLLYGFAAAASDPTSIQPAIAAFSRYVALEPAYATGWVNLAALYAQAGDHARAVSAGREAVAAAPEFWVYQYLLGRLEERAGNPDNARAIYQYMLASFPDVTLLPEWNTPLRDELAAQVTLSPLARAALLLQDGDIAGAWVAFDAYDAPIPSAGTPVIEGWLLLAEGQTEDGEALLNRVIDASGEGVSPWAQVARAILARQRDEPVGDLLAEGRAALEREAYSTDDADLPNIHYIQYLHTAIPRTYLPQVGFPPAEPLLLYLLHADR